MKPVLVAILFAAVVSHLHQHNGRIGISKSTPKKWNPVSGGNVASAEKLSTVFWPPPNRHHHHHHHHNNNNNNRRKNESNKAPSWPKRNNRIRRMSLKRFNIFLDTQILLNNKYWPPRQ